MRKKSKKPKLKLLKPFPARTLQNMAYALSRQQRTDAGSDASWDYDAMLSWRHVWVYWLGFKGAFDWNSDSDRPVPMSVKMQLVGQTATAGLNITHRGKACYVIEIDLDPGTLNKTLEWSDTEKITYLFAVETKYINMGA